MRTNIITLTILVLFAMSCNNGKTSGEKSDDVTIVLKDGQKWTVNQEMTPYILESEKLFNEYNNGDFKMLAQQLKLKNDGLIKSCTMKGESHDELHKWLHPHLELVNELSKAASEEKADEVISKLGESFKLYHQNFQ